MLIHTKELARRNASEAIGVRFRDLDGIIGCSDVESPANGNDSDFLLPFYIPARTEIRDTGMPGTREYRDWLDIELPRRTLVILFTDDFGEPDYAVGEPITLEVFEGWQQKVVAIPHCEAERVDGMGWVMTFDLEVQDE